MSDEFMSLLIVSAFIVGGLFFMTKVITSWRLEVGEAVWDGISGAKK